MEVANKKAVKFSILLNVAIKNTRLCMFQLCLDVYR